MHSNLTKIQHCPELLEEQGNTVYSNNKNYCNNKNYVLVTRTFLGVTASYGNKWVDHHRVATK